MKSILITSALGLTLLATSISATAAVNTDETSVWRKVRHNPAAVTETVKDEKSQVWRKVRHNPVAVNSTSKATKSQVWRKVRH